METKFQTSFIPKKNVVPVGGATVVKHKHTTSLLMTISSFIFILSILAVGGVYMWKQYLVSTQAKYKEDLARHERAFNIDLIEDLKKANVRIDVTKKLLTNHLALSQIFEVISKMTIVNVRFLDFSLVTPANPKEGIKITMKGMGNSLASVAFQSDVLNQLEEYGLRKVIKNPILADPIINDDRTVNFSFSATIDTDALSYTKYVTPDVPEVEPETPNP